MITGERNLGQFGSFKKCYVITLLNDDDCQMLASEGRGRERENLLEEICWLALRVWEIILKNICGVIGLE